MYEYRTKAPHLLSGGQKQRIAIAGVLAMKPECIILDEPTAMLDLRGRDEVLNIAKQLNDEGITVILITHFMEEAAIADKLVIMNEGSMILNGTPEEVFLVGTSGAGKSTLLGRYQRQKLWITNRNNKHRLHPLCRSESVV